MADNLDASLKKILRLRPRSREILFNRESTRIEFKRSFTAAGLAKYVRTVIAFANRSGGYIVFGVENQPHRVIGVNPAFLNLDPATLSTFMRGCVSPEPSWAIGTIDFHQWKLGYLHCHEARDKPVMATANHGKDLKEAAVYYRYRGQSALVRFTELREMIETRIGRERRAMLKHLEVISRAGARNVAVLDTAQGLLSGTSGSVLVEEALLRKLKFVQEGHFTETGGDPTLRIIGDVVPIGNVVAERTIERGIHADDLYRAFLADRQLTPQEALNYLLELPYQVSTFFPLHFFLAKTGLSTEDAVGELEAVPTTNRRVKTRLLARLGGEETIEPIGARPADHTGDLGATQREFLAAFQDLGRPQDQRGFFLRAVEERGETLAGLATELPVNRICEALTWTEPDVMEQSRTHVLRILLTLLDDKFGTMTSTERFNFRKAVAYVDEALR